ncbi:MAG: hypothetical protein ACRDKA_11375 [Actinomycetota bacterium]
MAFAVAVALLLAGCARAASPGPAAPPPDSPVTATLSTPGPEPSALPVSPRPGLVDVRPHPWDRAEVIGKNRVRLEFYGGIEPCEGVDRVEVDEGEEAVTVTIFVGRVATAEVCIEIAVLKSVTILVDGPIGGRDIVDGTTGT